MARKATTQPVSTGIETLKQQAPTPVSTVKPSALEVAQEKEKAAEEALSSARAALAKALPGQRGHANLRVVQLQAEVESARRVREEAQDKEFAAECRELMEVPGFKARVLATARIVWGGVSGVDMAAVEAAVLDYIARKGGVCVGAKKGDVMFHSRLRLHVATVCGMQTREQRERNAAANKRYEAELAEQGREASARLARERKAAEVKLGLEQVALQSTLAKEQELSALKKRYAEAVAACAGDKTAALARLGVASAQRFIELMKWERAEMARLAAEMAAEQERAEAARKESEKALFTALGGELDALGL